MKHFGNVCIGSKKSVNAERNRLALWGAQGGVLTLGGGGGAHKSSLTTLIKQHWAREVLRQGTAWNFRLVGQAIDRETER